MWEEEERGAGKAGQGAREKEEEGCRKKEKRGAHPVRKSRARRYGGMHVTFLSGSTSHWQRAVRSVLLRRYSACRRNTLLANSPPM